MTMMQFNTNQFTFQARSTIQYDYDIAAIKVVQPAGQLCRKNKIWPACYPSKGKYDLWDRP